MSNRHESKTSDDRHLVVGQLAGVYGIKGWLKVKSFTQPDDNILNYVPWLLNLREGQTEVEIEDFKKRPQGLIVKLKGIDDRDVAAQLGRAGIAVAAARLPQLEDGDFYHFQLVGLKVFSVYSCEEQSARAEDGELLGVISSVLETGANDVLTIRPCEGSMDDRERLVPYVPDLYVLDVNIKDAQMTVDWDPEF